jgi:haloacid dehalogenase-like hydrolase
LGHDNFHLHLCARFVEPGGHRLAMGNASAEVQRLAQFVTTSNEEEGFANAMEAFILGDRRELAEKAS